MKIFPILATIWMFFWFVMIIKSTNQGLAATLIAWFFVGWIPPLFFLLMVKLVGKL